jgi:hypothetical protein
MWQKTAPLEAVFGSLSTQKSLHRRPLLMFSLSLPPPSSSSEAYFGSTSSVPRMDSSRSTQPGHGSRYIWDRVPNQSSRLPPSSSFLSVLPQYPRRPPSSLLLSKLKLLISFEIPYERTIITIPLHRSPSTLDRSCVPRGDIGETGAISKD